MLPGLDGFERLSAIKAAEEATAETVDDAEPEGVAIKETLAVQEPEASSEVVEVVQGTKETATTHEVTESEVITTTETKETKQVQVTEQVETEEVLEVDVVQEQVTDVRSETTEAVREAPVRSPSLVEITVEHQTFADVVSTAQHVHWLSMPVSANPALARLHTVLNDQDPLTAYALYPTSPTSSAHAGEEEELPLPHIPTSKPPSPTK
ncbi:uncharacterized protein PITG_06180 [Phytophthora infestans T30-4]|uniref:Uncharacterized protein n=1 Tax=Phytophthora infestans (strain T30-4) TaxID=403677 RepID=D0N497_PHYIT|nr:uncharacterized protein PITG_06180 [Phytophthora infestans T30-4]EEY69705.1 conserved hypothetical protein [Phytophthora infestans T30-4]|eukprot:XP_002998352.1 conserved hypothetical protein [Phytophthora infestans T30-4]